MSRKSFDPATLDALWNRLAAIADEAAASLVRASFSTTVREGNDFGCALLDPAGNLVAHSSLTPAGFAGTLPHTAKRLLREFPAESFRGGDMVLTNDPWVGAGHLSDICSLNPLFHRGRLAGFLGVASHVVDMGGRLPSSEARELFEEGLRVPPCKFLREGEPNEEVRRLLRANLRLPEQVEGDILAQAGASRAAERRLGELLEEHRLANLSELALSISHRSENAMREAAKLVPDGEYPFQLQTDGHDEPLTLRVEVRVRGSAIHVDYTGSSPQVDRGVNVPPAFAFAYTAYALKCVLCPQVPTSEGTFKPIAITAPEGTVLNPRFPAPVNGRSLLGHFIPAAIFGALAKVIPQRVPAAAGAPIWSVNAAGADRDGRRFAVHFHLNPGQGAAAGRDGQPCLSFPSNLAATPVEVIEGVAPILIERKALLPDSGGAGRFRGGNGQAVLIKSLAPGPLAFSFLSDRTRHPAYGLFGGKAGRAGRVLLNGRPINPKRQWLLHPGDRLVLELPGGGGYGNPKERDLKLIERDIQEGLVSLHRARTDYGYMGEPSQP